MSQQERSIAWLKSAEQRVQRPVCPIYDYHKGHPLVGSSVLVGLSSAVLLVTADHVLRNRGDLYLWGQNGLIGLWGKSYRNRELDFGFIRLDDALAAELQNYTVLRPENIDVDDFSIPHSLYAFVGFPETRNRPRAGTLQRSSVVFLVESAGHHAFSPTNARPETHIVVEFDRKRLGTDKISGTVTGPDPHGMSGGGVWRIRPPGDLDKDSPIEQMVGIGIKYEERSRLLVGLRMSIVISSIAHVYPNLAPELPPRLKINLETGP